MLGCHAAFDHIAYSLFSRFSPASLRKGIRKIEVSQHSRYTCSFCGRNSVKVGVLGGGEQWVTMGKTDSACHLQRTNVGIWECKACKKVVAGGAWTVSTTAAVTVRR